MIVRHHLAQQPYTPAPIGPSVSLLPLPSEHSAPSVMKIPFLPSLFSSSAFGACPQLLGALHCSALGFTLNLQPSAFNLQPSLLLFFASALSASSVVKILFLNSRLSTFDFQPSISSKSFACHTSENSSVSPIFATLLKTPFRKSFACHTSETPRGVTLNVPTFQGSTVQRILRSIPFVFRLLRTLLRNGAPLSLFFSCISALFSMQRRGCPLHLLPIEEQHAPANN